MFPASMNCPTFCFTFVTFGLVVFLLVLLLGHFSLIQNNAGSLSGSEVFFFFFFYLKKFQKMFFKNIFKIFQSVGVGRNRGKTPPDVSIRLNKSIRLKTSRRRLKTSKDVSRRLETSLRRPETSRDVWRVPRRPETSGDVFEASRDVWRRL